MSPNRAKELLPVIQAFAEGKKIQSRCVKGGDWIDISQSTFCDECDYRIKPEPREWWIKVAGKYDESDAIHSYRVADAIHVREVLE